MYTKAKKFKRTVLGLAIMVGLFILHVNFGIFNRFNIMTAYWDKWQGNERIIIYGEPYETDSLKTALAPKFGFKYERQEDCTVTKAFVNGVTGYNNIMGHEITERLGDNWDSVLNREISKMK